MEIESCALDSRLIVFGILQTLASIAILALGGLELSANNWWGLLWLVLGLALANGAIRHFAAARCRLQLADTAVLGLGNPAGPLPWSQVASATVVGGRLTVVPKQLEQYSRSPHPYLLHIQAPRHALVAKLEPAVVNAVETLIARVV